MRSSVINTLKDLPPRYYFTWTLMLLSVAAMYVSITKIHEAYDRKAMVPGLDKRVDITKLLITDAQTLCPEVGRDGQKKNLESCIPKLERNLNKLKSITVPTIDDVFASYAPRFLDVLRKQDASDIADSMSKGNIYVIGFPIPSDHFSPEALGEEVWVLSFHFMIDAYFCIDGSCFDKATRFDNYSRGVKLIEKKNNGQDMKIVWAFARDLPFNVGIPLLSGIFVTKNIELTQFNHLGVIASEVMTLLFSVLFFGIVLFLFFVCLFFGYVDYALFTIMCLAVGLFSLSEPESILMNLDGLTIFKISTYLELNMTAAAILFSFSTIRPRLKILIPVTVALQIVALGVAQCLQFYDLKIIVSNAPKISLANAYFCALIAPLFSLGGAANCIFLAYERRKNAALRMESFDLIRRAIVEQIPISICIFLFAGNLISYASSKSQGLSTEKFLPTASLLFFVILAIMIANNLIQFILTNVNRATSSESDYVRHRLSKRALQKWYARSRDGVFINIDLKGATKASQHVGAHMHHLIHNIGEALRRSAFANGYGWVHDTTKGDEWIIAHSRKHENISTDLSEIVEMVLQIEPLLSTLTKEFANEYEADLALHVSIFSVRQYFLGAEGHDVGDRLLNKFFPKPIGYQSGSRKPDFVGEEINYIMKFSGKPESDVIRVSGTRKTLEDLSIKQKPQLVDLEQLIDVSSRKANLEQVKVLDLVFCDIRKKLKSGKMPSFKTSA